VAPSRRIGGPNSEVNNIYGLAADSKRDCIIVANRVESAAVRPTMRFWVFNRTDNGDRSRGRRSRAAYRDHQDPQVFVDEDPRPDLRDNQEQLRGVQRRRSTAVPVGSDRTGFIGVWSIDDNGDVPPRGVIKGQPPAWSRPAGVAINPKHHESMLSTA